MDAMQQQYYNNGMNQQMGMGMGYGIPGVNMGMGGMAPNMGMANGQGYWGTLGMPAGNQYGAVRKPPMMTQPLSEERIAALKNKGAGFDTRVSREDLDRAICTHKDHGQIVAFMGNDNKFICPICGESWNPVEYTEEEVNAKVEDLIDHLQMIKLQYLNAPAQTIEEFFPIIPLMRKIGKFTTIAANDFAMYDQSYVMNQQQGFNNGYAMLNQLTNGFASMGGGYNPAMNGYNVQMGGMGYNPAMQQGMMMQPGGMQGVPNQQMMQSQPQPIGNMNPAMMQNQGYPQNMNYQATTAVNPLTMAGGNEFGYGAPVPPNAVYNGYANPNAAMMQGQSNPNIPNNQMNNQAQQPVGESNPAMNQGAAMEQPKEIKVTKAYQA